MFRTVPLSIISSFSLYTQQWYMSYMLRAGSGRSVLILLATNTGQCDVTHSCRWVDFHKLEKRSIALHVDPIYRISPRSVNKCGKYG